MKKIVLLLIILFITGKNSNAQVTQLIVGVDGFTCSLCAKGVEEQFKSLDFVKSVKTDLKNTLFILTFKSQPQINVSQIRDAVSDGGFTMRDIKVEATGIIKGDSQTGFVLVTSNTPDITLKDVNADLSNGDKVSLEGNVNADAKSISVTSIKKL